MSGVEFNPYEAPVAAAAPARTHRTWRSMWFGFEGRISRSQYWINGVVLRLVAAVFVAIAIAILLSVAALFFDDAVLEPLGTALAVAFGGGYLWSELAVTVKRLHDRDQSGWWAIGYLIPLVNVWVYVSVCFFAGTQGPNRYGDDPVLCRNSRRPSSPRFRRRAAHRRSG